MYFFEWAHNDKWNESEKRIFFEKLKRSRDKAHYLRVKAGYLYGSKVKAKILVAIELLNIVLEKYPNNFDLATCYLQLAECYSFLNQNEKAIEYFEKCIVRQKEFTNLRTTAGIEYPEFIVKNGLRNLYQRALDILEEEKKGGYVLFPFDAFLYHGLRALIFKEKRQHALAHQEVSLAIEASKMKQSGFRYHPKLGIVSRNHWLLKEIKKL